MRFFLRVGFGVIIFILGSLALLTGIAYAHERRDVGKYQFVVGWIVEPAFEGMKNGLDLRVTDRETQKPVEGLENTLKWEVTHVPSGVSKTLTLRTIFRDPGHYTADLIPTAPGVYRFRIFGTIEGTAVNETFVSEGAGGSFGDIESAEELQFPEKLPELREVASAARGTQNTAQQAQGAARRAEDSASAARNLALLGIGLGALGIAFGVGSLVVALRKR